VAETKKPSFKINIKNPTDVGFFLKKYEFMKLSINHDNIAAFFSARIINSSQ